MGGAQSQPRIRKTNWGENIPYHVEETPAGGHSQTRSQSSNVEETRDGGHSQTRSQSSTRSTSKPRKPNWGDFSAPSRSMTMPSKKFAYIADQYSNLDEVQSALRVAGLESSNLILAIDFTKSNEWTGRYSFHGRSLHAIADPAQPNPYEQAIAIIGQTLAVFDEDNMIPCFGFGDSSTHDQYAFSFYGDHHPCHGFGDALDRYRQIAPKIKLSGPTSFAPAIEAAIRTVEGSGGQYHVLVIVADGQVTSSTRGGLSPQEKATIDALVAASEYPLSIILVGVGDGPWDTMRQFDDNVRSRVFDNFQFVNFSEIMAKPLPHAKKEALFALAALMEIPQQYKATIELGLLGKTSGTFPTRAAHPPPHAVLQLDYSRAAVQQIPIAYPAAGTDLPSISSSSSDQSKNASTSRDDASEHLCPICLSEKKDLAFGCGHQTCRDCGKDLERCPICRSIISTKIRLY